MRGTENDGLANYVYQYRTFHPAKLSLMSLETGARLGPYTVTGKLGVGGMGEVYRAHDSRLNREVAVKVLKAEVSDDPARRTRFEQEARAAAALNHPNIVSLFDVGTHEGALYIVTELVPGDGLDVILQQGQMPVKRLLDIATQIADGMAAAHALPLTHRDLKPANVIVTPDGRAKILDFGLAKMGRGDGKGEDATLTAALTQDGQVLGTVNYMSPEQAVGKDVDTRSDQFSFGAMLHEMVTGKKPFTRESMVQTMSAIVTDDAPAIDREIPAPLKWIIARCLAKAPVDRYQSTRDLFLELRSLKEHLSDLSSVQVTAVEPVAPPQASSWKKLALGFAAGAALVAATSFFMMRGAPPKTGTHTYTPFSFEAGGNTAPVWSPDGKGVAFAARASEAEPYQVYVRYLDSSTATQLTKIPEGGQPVAWTKAGRIVFRSATGLLTISPVGGEPEPLVTLTGRALGSADVSPDGSVVAYYDADIDGMYTVMLSAPAGSPAKPYAPAPFAAKSVFNGFQVKFSPDGKQILLVRNPTTGEEKWLMPYPPDASNPPHLVLEKFPQSAGTPTVSWMPDSRRIVLSMSTGAEPGRLYLGDTVSGEYSVLSSGTTTQAAPAVSPDGSRLMFEERVVDFDIVSADLGNGAVTPLLSTSRSEDAPAWAASAMVHLTDRNGAADIWLHKPGEGDRPLVLQSDFPGDNTRFMVGPALSPDGNRVIFRRTEKVGRARLWMSAISGGSPVSLIKDGKGTEHVGGWSPDGAWYVFWNQFDGKMDIYKVKTSGQAIPELLKSNIERRGDWVPVWSPAGDWILHSEGGVKLISSDGKTERQLSGKPATVCAFSRDGATVYCIREGNFVSMPTAGGPEKRIGSISVANRPISMVTPSLRMTLTPDGKSFTYSILKQSSNLWMLSGIE